MGAVSALMPLLVCDIPRIQQPALQCYAAMSFQNGAVSLTMKSGKIVIIMNKAEGCNVIITVFMYMQQHQLQQTY